MKKILLASACIFALATPAAFAQTAQPTGGAASQGNAGTGAAKDGTMNQGTTGTSRPSAGSDASTSGAGPAGGPNNTGSAKEPGAVQKGVNKQ
jgi:opacity protein-like surface antigen